MCSGWASPQRLNRAVPVSYSVRHPGKVKQSVAKQTGSIERPRRGFGTTPGGRAFVWLLTLTSVAVVLAVWFSFRGANETPQESPAEVGAAGSTPSMTAPDAVEVTTSVPAIVLPPLLEGP